MPTTGSDKRYRTALAIDSYLGRPLCAALYVVKRMLGRPKPPPPPDQVKKILVVKMWGMGSIVLASPLLPEIRSRYPKARIDYLSLRENLPLLGLYPEINETITLDLSFGILHFLRDTLGKLRRLRHENYDLILDLEFFTRFTAIVCFLIGAGRTHGFSTKNQWRGKIHEMQVPFNVYNHVTVNFMTLLRGNPMEPSPLEESSKPNTLPLLKPPPGAWENCRAVLSKSTAWHDDRPIVAVNPNTGAMALERRWPAERMSEFLCLLVKSDQVNVVLTGSDQERPFVEAVIEASGVADHLVNLAGRISIAELVGLYSHAHLVITNDSGPLHIACAAGASTVALFGPESPTLYGPLRARQGQQHAVHYRKLGCSPCMFVHNNKVLSCWYAQAECMTGIKPAEVLASVRQLLKESHGPERARV